MCELHICFGFIVFFFPPSLTEDQVYLKAGSIFEANRVQVKFKVLEIPLKRHFLDLLHIPDFFCVPSHYGCFQFDVVGPRKLLSCPLRKKHKSNHNRVVVSWES